MWHIKGREDEQSEPDRWENRFSFDLEKTQGVSDGLNNKRPGV